MRRLKHGIFRITRARFAIAIAVIALAFVPWVPIAPGYAQPGYAQNVPQPPAAPGEVAPQTPPGKATPPAVASQCIAMARHRAPSWGVRAVKAAFTLAQSAAKTVSIRYVTHSTFLITSPEGVKIATDYAGFAGVGVVPDIVTMNRAHSSHFTDQPDPQIRHVLRGWNPEGGYAHHNLRVKDFLIRNVSTNIRDFWGGGTVAFGNSIFIFETAGLCIGHLGHLHHELTAQQIARIGQLDIVMAPVDGAVTLDFDGMMKVLKQLKARVVMPMHFFTAGSLETFLSRAQAHYQIRRHADPEISFSIRTLPKTPQVIVLPGF